MDNNNFFKLFEELLEDEFCFIYQAKYQEKGLTERIIQLAEGNYRDDSTLSAKKNINCVLVESFQNLLQHSFRPPIVHRTNNFPEMFMIRKISGRYYIATTNLILNDKTENLRNKIKELNKLSKEELKSLYLQTLKSDIANSEFSNLGLIEIAKRSGKKLAFEMVPINYYLSLFYLQVEIGNDTTENTEEARKLPIDAARRLHINLTSDSALLVYKGNFSQESILPMLNMIENNLKMLENMSKRKKVLYVLLELLQNISRHGNTKKGQTEGILIIGIKGKSYFIKAGNFILSEKVESLQHKLSHLLQLSKKELESFYKEGLLNGPDKTSAGAGIGLAEIIRYSDKASFEFKAFNEELNFFSLNIEI
jgi:hypothetical protein